MNIHKLATIGRDSATTGLGEAVHTFSRQVDGSDAVPANLGEMVFSTEGHSDVSVSLVSDTLQEITTAFEQVAAATDFSVEAHNLDAARMGFLLGTSPNKVIEGGLPKVSTHGSDATIVNTYHTAAGHDERAMSYEAFDEVSTNIAPTYSFFYNAMAAKQDALGELFYPTLPVSPDAAGFGVSVRILRQGRSVEHSTTGAVTKFKWVNAIRGVTTPSLLRTDATRLVPVYRAGVNEDKFVNGTNSADFVAGMTIPMVETVGGSDENTMPLLFGEEVNLLGISQTDALLSKGIMNETDTVDPSLRLKSIMFGISNAAANAHDGFIYDVSGLPTANFTFTAQGSNQDLQLDFDSDAVILSADLIGVDGSAIDASEIPAGYKYRIRVEVSGRSNAETGNTVLDGLRTTLVSVMDDSGNSITDPTDAKFIAAKAIVGRVKLLGYTLDGYRKNCNKRTMDNFIDTTVRTGVYPIRYRSSFFRKYCPGGASDSEPADLNDLINFTRIAIAGDAVTELLQAASTLSGYERVLDDNNEPPEVLGMGRLLVVPTMIEKTLDMTTEVDPGTAGTRARDIQATLVNYMRDYAARMVLESEYASALSFSDATNPTYKIVVATDPVIHRYLTAIDGDLRTLGDNLDVEIVSTTNIDMRGKIVMGIGLFDNKRNQVANPLNHGNMGWAPEVTVVLNSSTGGAHSRVLAVTPRYLHVTHLPVMAVLNVNNLPDTLGKLAQLRQTV